MSQKSPSSPSESLFPKLYIHHDIISLLWRSPRLFSLRVLLLPNYCRHALSPHLHALGIHVLSHKSMMFPVLDHVFVNSHSLPCGQSRVQNSRAIILHKPNMELPMRRRKQRTGGWTILYIANFLKFHPVWIHTTSSINTVAAAAPSASHHGLVFNQSSTSCFPHPCIFFRFISDFREE